MGTNYSKGRKKEYECMKALRSEGYKALRTAGSHGEFDVIGYSPEEIRFIQVKSTQNKYEQYKDEIEILKDIKLPPNTTKELWIWQTRKGWLILEID